MPRGIILIAGQCNRLGGAWPPARLTMTARRPGRRSISFRAVTSGGNEDARLCEAYCVAS